jgi:ribosomal protein S12 methylthiotransferase accessory factor
MDYGCHLQLHLDPEIQARFESELAGAVVGEVDLDSLTSPIDTESALTGSGFRPAWVDLTTADVLRAGLHVVRAVVPGCLTNAAAGLPFLGSPRLVDSLAGHPIRTIPLPH